MLSTEAPTAYVRKSPHRCGKACSGRDNDSQRRKRTRYSCYWLKFDHHSTGHGIQGLQRITNILSTCPHTENVGKNKDREAWRVEKNYKNPRDRAIKN
jgi:coproporphyrinogen III oxidase